MGPKARGGPALPAEAAARLADGMSAVSIQEASDPPDDPPQRAPEPQSTPPAARFSFRGIASESSPKASRATASPKPSSPAPASPSPALASSQPGDPVPLSLAIAPLPAGNDRLKLLARGSAAVLNPGEMARASIAIGDLVFIARASPAGSLPVVATAWPSIKIGGSQVGVDQSFRDENGLRLADKVSLRRVTCPVLDAERLVLRTASYVDPAVPPLDTPQMRSYLAYSLAGRHVLAGSALACSLYGRSVQLGVVEAHAPGRPSAAAAAASDGSEPEAVYRVTERTAVELAARGGPAGAPADREAAYAGIGGLEAELAAVREAIEAPLHSPDTFARFGIKPPRGVLLYGPSGAGKTMVARAVMAACGAACFAVGGADVASKFVGESETRLREVFERAAAAAPAVVFLDDIDALCPRRAAGEAPGEGHGRLAPTLLALIDGLEASGARVSLLAATARPNALEAALRRPGRFDREVEIGVPGEAGRLAILGRHLRGVPVAAPAAAVERVAAATHGYVGADLAALCREAALRAMRRAAGAVGAAGAAGEPEPEGVSESDLEAAMAAVRPSAMREVAVDVPRVRWDEIGGLGDVKARLQEAVLWPLAHRAAFERLGVRAPRGLLLYGPPGCSKTLMAKALATEAGLNFLAVKGPELFGKYVGESEAALREVFRKARAAAPSIVFFDEIDALGVSRGGERGGGGGGVGERVLSTLLNEMDGIEALHDVVVLAATNRPDLLDAALMRPGRLDRVLYVGLPDAGARAEILAIHTRRTPLAPDVDLPALAARAEGYSGAELAAVCREAALAAMRPDPAAAREVRAEHFERALAAVQPRTSPLTLSFYDSFRASAQSRLA